MDNSKYKDAIERQADFGRLFVEYDGCPRGACGRACCPTEDEVLIMPELTDVDGGRWIPVNADALMELVSRYKTLAVPAKKEIISSTELYEAVRWLVHAVNMQQVPMPEIVRKILNG